MLAKFVIVANCGTGEFYHVFDCKRNLLRIQLNIIMNTFPYCRIIYFISV